MVFLWVDIIKKRVLCRLITKATVIIAKKCSLGMNEAAKKGSGALGEIAREDELGQQDRPEQWGSAVTSLP